MAEFNLLSWNVESFGEKKVDTAANFIAAVIKHYNVNMVMFLETTRVFQYKVMAYVGALLGDGWQVIGSDETGKSTQLPLTIPFTDFPKSVDRSAYEPELKKCYDVQTDHYQLKSSYTANDAYWVREALVRAGIIRIDQETYTGFVKYDTVMVPNQAFLLPNSYLGVATSMSRLRSTNAAGAELGYQDPHSVFNGRMPYVSQMFFRSPSSTTQVASFFPLVSFHAPFGANQSLRIPAINNLLNLGTHAATTNGEVNVSAMDRAIVMGDFNIDFDPGANYNNLPTPIPTTYSKSQQAYGPFVQAGFTIQIREKSSLIKVDEDPGYTRSTDYRSSAYDNIMTKGFAQNTITQAGVLDLILDTYNSDQTGQYLYDVVDVGMPEMYEAYLYYKTNVSDHLPVLIKIQVPDRT